ncbi:MAG: FHA domain-containing protein [Phycisphaerae bacterium]|nr:FHA domain-containing protein [Phycisphaerae bacterium]
MAVLVSCPKCERPAKLPQDSAGKTVRCTGCEQTFRVPHGTGDLAIEWGPIGAGRKVPISPGRTITIGRTKDNLVCLPGALVSRRHAILKWNVSEWKLLDAGSTNGTFVNGQRVREVGLTDGSRIVIGDFALRLAVVSSGPSDLDTALDAMAVEESRSGTLAVVTSQDLPLDAADSRADTASGEVALTPPDTEQPGVGLRHAATQPSRRGLLERWPVVLALAALVIVAVGLLIALLM